MNYLASVTYIFKDKHWRKKMGLATLVSALSFTVIGWMILEGWHMEVFRRAADDADEDLPGWEHWRTYLPSGLKYVVLCLILLLIKSFIKVFFEVPSWLIRLPFDLLLTGALITLVRTGSFGRALNPVSALRVLMPNLAQWIVLCLAVWLFVTLPVSLMTEALMPGPGLAGPAIVYLVTVMLNPWSIAIIGNLYGRLYRQSGATV